MIGVLPLQHREWKERIDSHKLFSDFQVSYHGINTHKLINIKENLEYPKDRSRVLECHVKASELH